jgi:hypothetical protein
MTKEVKEILGKIREKKIKNPIYVWETYYNKALDEAMDECINYGKNEGAIYTIQEDKGA